LVIGEKATVKANIKASTVIIRGTVYGNIEAKDKIEIQTEGKLFGNIRTSKLIIADGVVFEGKCEMIKQPVAVQKLKQVHKESTTVE